MKSHQPVNFRAHLSEVQSARLLQRVEALPFKVDYQEEQRGAELVVRIACMPAHESHIRAIFQDLGLPEEQ